MRKILPQTVGIDAVIRAGSGPLMALYGRAIVLAGGEAVAGDPDAAARGLALIGERSAWM